MTGVSLMAGLRALLAALAIAGAARPASAAGEDAFYRGKTIVLVVSTGTGGGYGQYAQLFAAHFGDHIAGHPPIVVQYMPGAGGLRAMDYLYNAAPKDGTTLGFVYSTMTTADVFFSEQAHFDDTKFDWIGNMDGEPAMCVFWHTAGADTLADLQQREFIVGSAGAGGAYDKHPRMLNNLLHTRLKIVTGYRNGDEIDLAMERGEVQGRCGWSPDSIESTRPQWLADHLITLPIQFGLKQHPRYRNVPLILDFVHDPDTKAALRLALAERDLLRPVLAPPGVPAERVDLLRKAFMETMQDQAFVAALGKEQLVAQPMPGAELQQTIAGLHAVSPAVMQRAVDLSK